MPRRPSRPVAGRLALWAAALTLALPVPSAAQEAAGAQLWRVAGATLPVPAALATGAAAAFWNPAQPPDSARLLLAAEAIETSDAIGASGFLTALRLRAGRAGHIGLLYGRMQLGGLVRTYTSPDPEQAGTIPFFTHAIGATWSGAVRGTALGATIAYHETRLDRTDAPRWTWDVGAVRPINDVVRVAVATHFLSRFSTAGGAQDVFAGAEYRVLHGPLWEGGPTANVRLRYGAAFAHGFAADHQAGAGIDFGDALAVDLLVARTGGYAGAAWREAAGLALRIGRYRVTFGRDGGANGIGSTLRVGLEARQR